MTDGVDETLLPISESAAGYREPEIEDLPEGWRLCRFDEIANLRRKTVNPEQAPDLPYVGLEHIDSGNPVLQRYGLASEVKSNKSRFYPGDVLYGKLRPYLDKGVLATQEGICSTDIIVLSTRQDFSREFLLYAVHAKSFIRHAVATTSGVNHPRTSWSSLRQYLLPAPPLEEQQAIARVLDSVQRAREATEKVMASARELKRSLMSHLFTYGPVPVAEADQVPTKETEFGGLPDHWDISDLKELAYVQTGVAKGRDLNSEPTVEVPYLRVANVQDGYLDLSEMKRIRIRVREIDRYGLQNGDVLLTEGGDFDKLGRGFIWRGQLPGCVHQNHVFAVRTARQELLPDYLAYCAQSRYGKSYFLQVAHQTTNLASINSTKLKAFPVPLPTLEEQRQIVEALGAVDGKIAAEEARRDSLEALFGSLIEELMTGRLRVGDLSSDPDEQQEDER